MEYICRLADQCQDDGTGMGGKGANLYSLMRAGFPVPPGFIILTSAYRRFVESNNLQKDIEQLARQVSIAEPSATERASQAVRNLFAQGIMPDDVRQTIISAYVYLGQPAVAVRSSATVEDLPAASFAGQQETYLNIVSTDTLLQAVRDCWSSLWTTRALSYRVHQGITSDMVSLAVVVQQMVPASAAGVLFTVNPVTGNRDEMLINAAWGLGEAIVSGQVNPDTITVEKTTGAVKQLIIGEKTIMTVQAQSGVSEQAVDPSLQYKAVLTNTHIEQLSDAARNIERHFNAPQDIEWAIANEQIYILQARPVTTPTVPTTSEAATRRREDYHVPGDDSWDRENEPESHPYDLWTRTNMGENFPFPITPLSSSIWPALFITGDLPPKERPLEPSSGIGKRFYGRFYINEGAVVHMYEQLGLPTTFLDAVWGSSERGLRTSDDSIHIFRLLRRLPPMIAGAVKQNRQQQKASQRPGGKKEKTPKLTNEQLFKLVDQWVGDFQAQDLRALDDLALWEQGVPEWGKRAKLFYTKVIIAAALAATSYYFLQRRIQKWTKSKEDSSPLVTALSGVYTAELGPALWLLAQTLRTEGLAEIVREHSAEEALALLQTMPEAQTFREQFAAFLQAYGYRCPNDAEFRNPRWLDEPAQVITLLCGYLQSDKSENPLETIRQQQTRREEATRRIAAQLNTVRRAIFRWLLNATQKNMRIRDNNRSYLTKFTYPMRTIVAELGRRWLERGWLAQPDDIFFLTVAEIDTIINADNNSHEESPTVSGKDLQTIAADRRAAFNFWYQIIPPDAISPDGTPAQVKYENGPFVQGIPASGGQVRGKARIVRSVEEALRLNPGDILVTQATDPGWTPVFPLVSGLVLEIGGQLSHGAIIAREYAIPAVINAQGAMQRIRDGQTIVVNGTEGRVYLGISDDAEHAVSNAGSTIQPSSASQVAGMP